MPNDIVTNPQTDLLHLLSVNHLGQVTADLDIGSSAVANYDRVRTWVRTPGFHRGMKTKSIRRLGLPMNPFSYSLRKTTYPQGTIRLTIASDQLGKYATTTYTGALSGVPTYVGSWYPILSPATMPEIDVNYLDELAKSRLLLESKDQKVNLVQAFAERRQTARLLVSTINRVVSAISSLKAGNLAGAASALGVKVPASRQKGYFRKWKEDQEKAVANAWLELQYGWKPLLSDVVGSAELLAQKNIREIRNRVTKSASQTKWSEGRTNPNQVAPFHIYRKVRRKMTVKYVIYWSTSEVNHTLTQVGITNPLLIAWELLPWSFVYDWFLPIGNYISTLDATNGLSFEKGCKTVYERIEVRGRTQSGRVPESGQGSGTLLAVDASASEYRDEIVNLTRTTLTEWPSANLPSFKNPFSGIHIANALALLKKTVKFK